MNSVKVPKTAYTDVTKYASDDALVNQRVRIPTVPMGVNYDKDAQDLFIDDLIINGAEKELVVDYDKPELFIKNGSEVSSISRTILNQFYLECTDHVQVDIDGKILPLQEALEYCRLNHLDAEIALRDDNIFCVNNSGERISIKSDDKSTELIEVDGYTDANGIYDIQIKDFNTAKEGQMPYKEGGVVKWKTIESVIVNDGFKDALDHSIPVKIGEKVIWSKAVQDNGSDVSFIDTKQFKEEIKEDIEEVMIDESVAYVEQVSGRVIGVGVNELSLDAILDKLDKSETISQNIERDHNEDMFKLSSQITALQMGLNNLIVETFDEVMISSTVVSESDLSNVTLDDDEHTLTTKNSSVKFFETSLDVENSNILLVHNNWELTAGSGILYLHLSYNDGSSENITLTKDKRHSVKLKSKLDKFWITFDGIVTIKNISLGYSIL